MSFIITRSLAERVLDIHRVRVCAAADGVVGEAPREFLPAASVRDE